MAAAKKKRAADNYLTDQNWDVDENEKEPETAGIFMAASEDILANRSFKKAKRRVENSESGDVKTSNPFGNFGGFGGVKFGGVPVKPVATTNPVKPVATTNPVKPSEDINKENKNTTDVSSFWKASEENKDYFATRQNNINSRPPIKPTDSKIDNNKKSDTVCNDKMTEQNNDVYFEQLISLNHSVLSWMKEHFDKNPCIDLTPVFKDYEKHLKDLEIKYAPNKKATECSTSKGDIAVFKTPESTHASPIISATAATTTISSLFSSTPIQQTSIFANAPKLNSGNLFKVSPLLSNNDIKKTDAKKEEIQPSKTDTANSQEDDESEPIPERKTIVEKDAFYQIRCKLFFKKGSQWQELGIGMLYLKPCGEKTQLLIRMETVTGKILLNITISSEMPISRSGKNNVMLVSVPNPPVYTKAGDGDNSVPCTYLIRVKGMSEADELLKKLKSSN